MNITNTELSDGKLTATVVIPASEVDAVIKAAYKDIANKYRFQGFRKGKAPRPMIDAMFGKDMVMAQATNDLLEKQEPQVINELDIVPVKRGDLKTEDPVADGQDYTFQIEYKVRPVADLSSYEPVEIEMPPAKATDREIDAQVKMLMGYHTSFQPVEGRGVENDDIVNAEIENVENGEALAGKGRMIMVGSHNVAPEFDEALLGMKVDESKEVSWTPAAAEGEEAAPVTVKVTVTSIRSRVTPELTDEFAKEAFGFDSIDAMRDAVRLEIEADKQQQFPGLKENNAVAALAERLQLDEMDEDYEQSVFSDLGQNFLSSLSQSGMSLDTWLQQSRLTSEQFIEDLHRQAADVARESLALDALARHLEVEVTEEDVDREFANAGVEDPDETKATFVADGRIPAVRDSIRRSKAVEWLVENAKVTEVDDYEKAQERLAEKSEGADKAAEESAE